MVALIMTALGLIATAQARADSIVQKGLQISPVPLDLRKKNRDLVGSGSYIVNGPGGCNDCHTSPAYEQGGDPFLGQPKRINSDRYMGGGRVFFPAPYPVALNGCVVSRNLTPQDGKPAGLTLAQFVDVMRTGKDPQDSNVPPRLLRVMPWPAHQEMTDRDLRAIYEFLTAIPSIPGPAQCP